MDNKEFVPYEQALILEELKFNISCFATIDQTEYIHIKGTKEPIRGSMMYFNVDCPTFSQAFKWFREEHKLQYWIEGNESSKGEIYYVLHGIYKLNEERNFPIGERPEFKTYEEAELACLKKLIEIIKKQIINF